MRSTPVNRSLVPTLLVIVVLTSALAILCPQGIHLPMSQGMSGRCALMTHSSVLGTAASSDWSTRLVSAALVSAVGLAATLALAQPTLVADHGGLPPGLRIDPLHGRLRI